MHILDSRDPVVTQLEQMPVNHREERNYFNIIIGTMGGINVQYSPRRNSLSFAPLPILIT